MKTTSRRLVAALGLVFFVLLVRGQDFTYETNDGTITITNYTGPGGAYPTRFYRVRSPWSLVEAYHDEEEVFDCGSECALFRVVFRQRFPPSRFP